MANLHRKPGRAQVLKSVLADLRVIRDGAFLRDRRSSVGVCAGQLLILLLQLDSGVAPRRDSLFNFVRFVAHVGQNGERLAHELVAAGVAR